MAKRITLKDTVPESEIVDLNEEFNAPNILLEETETDGWGISGYYGGYSLVKKKVCYRTGNESDGENEGKVIRYRDWVDAPCYVGTLVACINNWAKKRNLDRVQALNKADFSQVEKIYNDTKKVISDRLSNLENNDDINSTAVELDNINELKRDLQLVYKILNQADELHELIKEKRAIIIKDTEPKKHRTPKDSE